jgi:hypothetical protein
MTSEGQWQRFFITPRNANDVTPSYPKPSWTITTWGMFSRKELRRAITMIEAAQDRQ